MSYKPLEGITAPDALKNDKIFLLILRDILLSRYKKNLYDRKLATAPVSISPLANMSPKNTGTLIRDGRGNLGTTEEDSCEQTVCSSGFLDCSVHSNSDVRVPCGSSEHEC